MRCAILDENGFVINVILADTPEDFNAIPCPDEVCPESWRYDESNWIRVTKEQGDDVQIQ